MVFQPDRPIKLEILVRAGQPALLQGLDAWLQLGLISNAQVKQICREHLVCALPEVLESIPAKLSEDDFVIEEEPSRSGAIAASRRPTPTSSPRRPVTTSPTQIRPTPTPPNVVAQRLQSLMAEISVVWLLFLGVFMVVVSSAVLAASQWRNFPPEGQYGILLAYTLAFCGASIWAKQQPNLQLTARMLQITTLLIIPVNFWMMDAFNLWARGWGWLSFVAAFLLTAILLYLLKPVQASEQTRLLLINSVALSWLHWGWGWSGVPLAATYIGTIGTALALFYQDRSDQERREPSRRDRPSVTQNPQETVPPETPNSSSRSPGLATGVLTVMLAALLLVARAVWVAQVPVNQLGLALGVCGWLLCWLSRRQLSRELWGRVGAGLLILGWLVSVTAASPWQAIAVSGLALWLLSDRLLRLRQLFEVVALFLVGLQAYWLLWRVVPSGVRQALLDYCAQVAGPTFNTWNLAGVGFWPFLVLTLVVAARVRRLPPLPVPNSATRDNAARAELSLADAAELLALGLGFALVLLSIGNPLLRSLTLLLATVTLGVVIQKRDQSPTALVYLTHGIGLSAIASIIDSLWPDLSFNQWAAILLVAMTAEWSVSATAPWLAWRRSAWHLGLGLSALSYLLFLLEAQVIGQSVWGELWLLTPIVLTILASRSTFLNPSLAAWGSVVALLFVQLLMFDEVATRLLGLGAATLLLLVNSRQIQQSIPTILTLGFGLSFAAAVVWEVAEPNQSADWFIPLWFNFLAIASLVLWLLQAVLERRDTRLAGLYARSADGWAVLLMGSSLILLTPYLLVLYGFGQLVTWTLVVATGLTIGAIAYRTQREPSNWGFYGIAWATELLAIAVLFRADQTQLIERPAQYLAIANLAFGLASQVLGDLWVQRSDLRYRSSWHTIPLIYAALGLAIQHGMTFAAETGLYTIGAALIGIGVGRRRAGFQSLTVLALLAGSFGAYELLVYQLLQAEGGKAGDGFVLLAALAALIAIAERFLARWLLAYLRLTPAALQSVTHAHWALGSALAILALFNSLSVTGEAIWMGVTSALAVYALVEGRDRAAWTYAGIAEAWLVMGYGLSLVVSNQFLLSWGAVIACAIAYLMYVLPWQRWGWEGLPWRQSAIVLPGVAVLLTSWQITIPSLLIVGAFYAWLAKAQNQTRLSYLSLLLADWAILRVLRDYQALEPLWSAAVLGVSLLYIAQIDPGLRSPAEREKRHLLRSLAVGLFCLTAIYEAETSIWIALLTLVLSVGLILAGLALRIRAFLYVGTATLVIEVVRQVMLLIDQYSPLLWAVLIVLGLILIWIAGTFEARRTQVNAFVQYWVNELESWE